MKIKKERSVWSIDVLGSKEQPITVDDDDDDEDQLIISIPDDEPDDVVCLDEFNKNRDNVPSVEINLGESFHRRPSGLNAVGDTGKELPLNNAPTGNSTVTAAEDEIELQDFRYFRNPMFQPTNGNPSKNENKLKIFPPIASTCSESGKFSPGIEFSISCQSQSLNPSSTNTESNKCLSDPPPEEVEIIMDDSSISSSGNVFAVPPSDPFFPPDARQQSFPTSSDQSNSFSIPENTFHLRENWKRSSSMATNESFESNTLRRPGYLPSPMSSTSDHFRRNQPSQPTFPETRSTFRNRNGPPRKYPPRVLGSVDVFVIHRDDDTERRVTSEDLAILNNYLGQCMFEEGETDFIMGFEYKKITNGQAQFNCTNKQMAIWTIDKIQKFTEMPMTTSLKNMRPRTNAFMWMTNLPHLGDELPKISDVLRGLAKCNPGFESHFKITVIRVTKQKHKPGKYYFQIMANEDLISYLRSKMEPPFMRICVLKYYNVKVFFKERG